MGEQWTTRNLEGEREANEDRGLIRRASAEAGAITGAGADMGVLEPEAKHPGWETYVSQRSVRAIAVAPRSRLVWLATWGGVLSWNRKEPLYRRYSSEHGLAGNVVDCLCVDQAERPWAGHAEGGLSYFSSPHWQVYEHLQDEPLRAVCAAVADEGIWAACERRVYRIPGPGQEPKLVALDHDGAIEAMALLDDGHGLLLGNAWGLFRLHPSAEPQRIAPKAIPSCSALARDGTGLVWIASNEAIYQLEGDALYGPLGPGPSDPVGRVLALSAGRRWAWVWTTAGLAQIKAGRWIPVHWQDVEHPAPRVQAIAVGTNDDYLWLGTDNRLMGVLAIGPDVDWDRHLLPAHDEDVLNNLGRCVARARHGGTVWAGTAGGTIAFGPGDEWSWSAGGDVRALAAGPPGQKLPWKLVWPRGISAGSGDGEAQSPAQPPDLPLAFALGQDGQPYTLTARGLWQLGDGPPQAWGPAPLAPARCLAQGPGGQWWMGTVRGVYRLVDGQWELAGEQPGPVEAGVHALATSGGTLWAATEAGLWARHALGWHEHSVDSQLVRAIAPAGDTGQLWVAWEDGIVCYDPTTGKVKQSYTPANSGLSSRRVTAMVQDGGCLWIVTEAGTNRLNLANGE